MKINKVHCFFEQSGTFKNAFKKYGVKAADYDIQDEFGETDHIVDLFVEIERAFDGRASIFDDIGKDDLIFAFFPCIRFENQIMLHFRGQAYQQKTWNDEDKCLYDLRLLDEVREMYQLINKLFVVCLRGGCALSSKTLIPKNISCVGIGAYLQALSTRTDAKTATIQRNRHNIGLLIANPNRTFCSNPCPKIHLCRLPIKNTGVGHQCERKITRQWARQMQQMVGL